ncbi:hypothetical protein AB0E08_07765 [Streptomyces sp. NPDC048281]|uniref:hypothetical protein n=1 Tax=Streptomyces sp. NPDC048281 TaxID=3154715 RepID=UPI00344890E4
MRNRDGQKEAWTRALKGLMLPQAPWTVEHLLRAYVEQVRGRNLLLSRDTSVVSVNGPSGMWFPTPKTDLVWAHPAAEGVQLDHVLGHELGHMVNGDEPDPRELRDVVRMLMGTYSPGMSGLWDSALAGAGVRCRAGETTGDDCERKAENFGYFVERWIDKNAPKNVTAFEANMRNSLDL